MSGIRLDMDDKSEEEKIEALAEMLPTFIGLAALFIPYLDLLERTEASAMNASSRTAAMAPVIGAMGGDWESAQFKADIMAKRSKALAAFVRVLKETDEEYVEHEKKQQSRNDGIEQLRKMGIQL